VRLESPSVNASKATPSMLLAIERVLELQRDRERSSVVTARCDTGARPECHQARLSMICAVVCVTRPLRFTKRPLELGSSSVVFPRQKPINARLLRQRPLEGGAALSRQLQRSSW